MDNLKLMKLVRNREVPIKGLIFIYVEYFDCITTYSNYTNVEGEDPTGLLFITKY